MRMSKRTLLAAAMLSGLAMPALALTQASISMTDFSFTLKDLNAADGVTPALTWGSAPWLNISSSEQEQQGWISTSSGSWTGMQIDWSDGANANASGAVSHLNLATPLGSGQASVDANGAISITMASAAGNQGYEIAQLSRGFTLSPGSQVTFSYVLSGALSGAGTDGSWVLPANTAVNNKSSASFSAQMGVGSISTQSSTSGFSNWSGSTDAYESVVDGQTMLLTLRNTDSVAKTYSLNVMADVNTEEAVSPVPEPASYALMALGLMVVGAAAKKRRRG